MRYYSEEIVKKIVKDAMDYGMTISQCIPMGIDGYPNIEIPEQHGDLIDKNYLKNNVSCGGDPELGEFDMVMWDDIENAPIVIEARK